MREEKIICIGCPLGCNVSVEVDDQGNIANITGTKCCEGEKHVKEEFLNPVRFLTATMRIENSASLLLPVKTSQLIPKDKLHEVMKIIASSKVTPPIKLGDVVISNVLDMGIDIIATKDLLQ